MSSSSYPYSYQAFSPPSSPPSSLIPSSSAVPGSSGASGVPSSTSGQSAAAPPASASASTSSLPPSSSTNASEHRGSIDEEFNAYAATRQHDPPTILIEDGLTASTDGAGLGVPFLDYDDIDQEAAHQAILAEERHSASHWGDVSNLDAYFTKVYLYFTEGGFWPLIVSRITNLITLAFTIILSVFLLICIDWTLLFQCSALTDANSEECSNPAIIRFPPSLFTSPSFFQLLVMIYFTVFSLYFSWHVFSFFHVWRDAEEMRRYFSEFLFISESDLGRKAVEWHTCVERIIRQEREGKKRKIAIVKEVTPLDITNRILRKENYLIAMINLNVFDFSLPFTRTAKAKRRNSALSASPPPSTLQNNLNRPNRSCNDFWQGLKDFFCCRLSYERIAEFTGIGGNGSGTTAANDTRRGSDEEREREMKRMGNHDEYAMIRDHEEHSTAIRRQMNVFQSPSSPLPPKLHFVSDSESALHSQHTERVDSPPLELLALERRQSSDVLRRNARHAKDGVEADEEEEDEEEDGEDEEETSVRGNERKLSGELITPASSSKRYHPSFFSKDGCWPSIIFSQSFEWNIRLVLLYSLFDSSSFRINKSMLGEAGIRSLQRRFFILGLINFLLLPFILLFILLFFILKHAEELHSKKTDFSLRQWTPHALWKMREFNELKHFFDRRMEISAQAAINYIHQFPSPILALFAQCIAFVSGAIVGILLLLTFSDSALLTTYTIFNRSLLWHLAFFSVILAVSRSFLPSSNSAAASAASPYGYAQQLYHQPPSVLLKEVINHTHYFPAHWKKMSLNSNAIYEEFKWMYRPRLLSFCYEIVSVLFLPVLLCYSMPRSCRKIANFMEQATITVEGVGDICAYAMFDLEKHGDKRYGIGARDNGNGPGNGGVRSQSMGLSEGFLSRGVSETIQEKEEVGEKSNDNLAGKKTSSSSPQPAANGDHFLINVNAVSYQQDNSPSGAASATASVTAHPTATQKLRRCNGGKLEKSFLSFAMNHPNWRADEDHQAHGGAKFLTHLSQSIAPLPPLPDGFSHLAKSGFLRKPTSMQTLNRTSSVNEEDDERDVDEGTNGRGSPFFSPTMSRHSSEESEQHLKSGAGHASVLVLQREESKTSAATERKAKERTPQVPPVTAVNKNSPQKSGNGADDLSASQHLVSSFYDLMHTNADKSVYNLNASNAALLQQQPLHPSLASPNLTSSLLLHRLHHIPSFPSLSSRGLSIQSPARAHPLPHAAATANDELAASLLNDGELFAVLETRAQDNDIKKRRQARARVQRMPPTHHGAKRGGVAHVPNSANPSQNIASSSASAFTSINAPATGGLALVDESSPRPPAPIVPPAMRKGTGPASSGNETAKKDSDGKRERSAQA